MKATPVTGLAFFVLKGNEMFKPKQYAVIASIALLVAAGVVWASNNVDAVEDILD